MWSLMCPKECTSSYFVYITIGFYYYYYYYYYYYLLHVLAFLVPSSGKKLMQKLYKTKYLIGNIKTSLQCLMQQCHETDCKQSHYSFTTKVIQIKNFHFQSYQFCRQDTVMYSFQGLELYESMGNLHTQTCHVPCNNEAISNFLVPFL
jgi:hypothetical protein